MNPISFDVSTFAAATGRQKKFTPDAKGTYNDVAIAVIGMASRNRVVYDPDSMVAAHNNPASRFCMAVTEGHAEGEWGHPFIEQEDERAVRRMAYIDRKNMSHFFSRCYTKPTGDGQYHVVYANINPFGPYGEFLKASFDNGLRNTAFSLRSLCAIVGKDAAGNVMKVVRQLITYDAVDLPGYKEASTWFGSTERFSIEDLSFNVDIARESSRNAVGTVLGMESITHQQVLDIFEADQVQIYGTTKGIILPKSHTLATAEGSKSVFHIVHRG